MAISGRQRLTDAALSRLFGRAPALHGYSVEQVRTPMRDGVRLLGDHFTPVTDRPRGTVLIRTPYGRGLPTSALNGRLFAARGYHVLLQSVRGTFGSEGTFTPMAQETEDGQDTVAWLREQPWFDGRLATLGASYLGWTQWTLLQDPPPELHTAVIYVGPHDFREAVYGTGAFTLGDFLGWSDQIVHQEDGGLRRVLSMATAPRRLRPALAGLPLPEAAEPVLRGRAPWYRQWLAHPDGDDPWWAPYRAGAALDKVTVPVLLIGGWQDLFLDQTLQQYTALRNRGVDVALTVGPWTHLQVGLHAAGLVARESLAWLDQHLAGGPAARKSPVRVHRTGERAWHDLPAWPPPTEPATFHLRSGRRLTTTAPGPDEGVAAFTYDPADPTPSVGGRTLTGSMGVKDNRALEARPDVLTFTTDPLPTAVDVIGGPTLTLTVTVDNPHADIFARLCDVDPHGRSLNFTDQHRRLDPGHPAGEPHRLELTLDPCFHRLLAGHRLRLQLSGGAFPRFARNPGRVGGGLAASHHTIDVAGCRLTIPVATAPPLTIR
ncbi:MULTISPECIES: CocE/NonD family hydrolase [unclassified Actinoplanes]|uniref:CocE/NonD family hydrolase n=1 Tax=unclassified Actinoplanes TaxID=2626549 RepID=UPI0002FD4B30|nr:MULTISPECIES: CocE/NonD family hydrolase [unclassified Actinoplanes]